MVRGMRCRPLLLPKGAVFLFRLLTPPQILPPASPGTYAFFHVICAKVPRLLSGLADQLLWSSSLLSPLTPVVLLFFRRSLFFLSPSFIDDSTVISQRHYRPLSFSFPLAPPWRNSGCLGTRCVSLGSRSTRKLLPSSRMEELFPITSVGTVISFIHPPRSTPWSEELPFFCLGFFFFHPVLRCFPMMGVLSVFVSFRLFFPPDTCGLHDEDLFFPREYNSCIFSFYLTFYR